MRTQIKNDANHMVKAGDCRLIIFCTQLKQLKAQWKKGERRKCKSLEMPKNCYEFSIHHQTSVVHRKK